MAGKLVYEVATLISETASEKIEQCMKEEGDDDPRIAYRGALILALVASESEKDTTKEELIAYLDKFYDIVHEKPTSSQVAPPRTKSAEFRLQLKIN